MAIPDMMPPVEAVNREEQIGDFRAAFDRIRVLGSVFQTLYEWYGGPGIGKSTLLYLLRKECDSSQIPYGCIDFNEKRNPRALLYKDDRSALIEDLLSGFVNTNVAGGEKVRNAIKEYWNAPSKNQGQKLDEVSRAFQETIGNLIENGTAVLFFDETEKADQELVVAWLEEWIVNPLVQDGRCLIVWAGRRPQRWKRFEVRRRARVQELGVFDEKGTEKLFKKNSSYPISDLAIPIRKLTGGHPYADTIVLRYLDYMAKEGRKPKKEQFDQIEISLLNELTQNFVDSYAFKDLPSEVVNASRVMSLVRQFDVIMLREILTEALPDDFGRYGRNEFGGLLSRLRLTQLVLWDDRRKGYALDPILRHIIGEYICQHNSERYVLVNRRAIEVYRDWINRAGDNRGIYIVEELYQQACLNRVTQEISRGNQLTVRLRQRITEYHQSDPDRRAAALDRLYHELEDDPDLPQLIGNKGLSQLLDIVRTELENIRNHKQ